MRKSVLFDPITIGSLELKNRVMMPSMLTNEVHKKDGVPTDFHMIHYGARALGGVGLILLEGTGISAEGRIFETDLGLWNEEQMAGMKRLVDLLHGYGSKVGVQLSHAGRKSEVPGRVIAPSAITYSDEYRQPEAMTVEDIQAVVEQFKTSAALAEKAGFDVLEVHVAHGYLLNQFITPLVNKRTDNYGGSLENRYRIVREVIHAVKSVFTGAVWARISGAEYDEAGTTTDEFVTIAQWMKEDGIELIDVSSGGVINRAPDAIYPGYQVQLGNRIKNEVGIPISVVGILGSPELAEYILRSNQSDLIALGRPLLSNPNWLWHAARELGTIENYKVFNEAYERGKRF